eukprot:361612-Chlamydomonas_euryale.AAC.2
MRPSGGSGRRPRPNRLAATRTHAPAAALLSARVRAVQSCRCGLCSEARGVGRLICVPRGTKGW